MVDLWLMNFCRVQFHGYFVENTIMISQLFFCDGLVHWASALATEVMAYHWELFSFCINLKDIYIDKNRFQLKSIYFQFTLFESTFSWFSFLTSNISIDKKGFQLKTIYFQFTWIYFQLIHIIFKPQRNLYW